MTSIRRGAFAVEVHTVTAPDQTRRILLQLPDGFILLRADDAAQVAAMLLDASDQLTREEP